MTSSCVKSMMVGGIVVGYRETGAGEPMLLIHGIGGSSESWAPQLSMFAKRSRLIAWDAPGYGNSELCLPDAPSVVDYLKPLLGLLENKQALEFGSAPIHILGHSLGALIAVRLATVAPERVASLTLIHPVLGYGRLPADEKQTVRAGRLKDYENLGPAEFARQRGRGILAKKASQHAISEAVRIMQAIAPAAYRCAWEMMVAENIFSYTGSINVPTLIICGKEDPVAPPAACKELAAAIDDAKLVVVENVGHYIMLEAPDEFERIYRDFRAGKLILQELQ